MASTTSTSTQTQVIRLTGPGLALAPLTVGGALAAGGAMRAGEAMRATTALAAELVGVVVEVEDTRRGRMERVFIQR